MLQEPTIGAHSFLNATGKIPYSLLNDYMFHITSSKNPRILIGLIAALLHMEPKDITTIEIKNPIVPGASLQGKGFILDVLVCINNNTNINLEIQVINEHNWQDRSLSYLCRAYDQLRQGQDYLEAQPAIHIGLLDFRPFPDNLEFYATYKLLNIKNQHLYSSKFALHVVDLTHIELATDEDKAYGIDKWARLFKATTWEEIKMLANDNEYITACADALYASNDDYVIREQCLARDEEIKRKKYYVDTLARQEQELKERAAALQEKDAEISRLKALLTQD